MVVAAKALGDPLSDLLGAAGRRFVLHWGEMGWRWGVNRTVSQIHALLFLAGRPIQARPVSRRERAVKWARRRPALAGLIAVAVVALIALGGSRLTRLTPQTLRAAPPRVGRPMRAPFGVRSHRGHRFWPEAASLGRADHVCSRVEGSCRANRLYEHPP